MKKIIVLGIMLIAFVAVTNSAQAKEIWVGAVVRGEFVHGRSVDIKYHPDARVSFVYVLDGSKRVLYASERETYEGRDMWIIRSIPDSINAGTISIAYPGCALYSGPVAGSGSFGRPGSVHGLVINDFREFNYYAERR
jgi:hypothetical protein